MFFSRNDNNDNNSENIISWLNQFSHPQLIENWAAEEHFVHLSNDTVKVTIPFAAATLVDELRTWIESNPCPVGKVNVSVGQKVATLKAGEKTQLKGVKNVIVVSSAKGGVGKSTTAVNLALALSACGAKTGLLDADIYGPSVPLMLGTEDKQPISLDGKTMQPIEAHGLYTNSIGYLVPADNAMAWRGPMASKAFSQLVNETAWPDLDYLVVDMPPGTGDIQLSLAQQFPVTAAVIVTTPQDLALADAVKGVSMFDKVNVPVLGVIENMSYHICSNCGHHEAIFGQGGAAKMAKEKGMALLAQMPLHISIREDIDNGVPTVAARTDSEHSALYLELARSVACRMYWQGDRAPDQISIQTIG